MSDPQFRDSKFILESLKGGSFGFMTIEYRSTYDSWTVEVSCYKNGRPLETTRGHGKSVHDAAREARFPGDSPDKKDIREALEELFFPGDLKRLLDRIDLAVKLTKLS